MKNSRKLFLLMSLVFVLVLSACGSADDSGDGADGDSGDSGDPTVALLIGQKGDLSFNDSAVRGVEQADEELDVDVSVIEYGTDPDNFEASVIDAAETGYDIIIVGSSLLDYVEDHAETYQDITWIVFDSDFDHDSGDYENVYSIVYSANEGAYLGGYLAANLTETDVLGFLGGNEAPIINDFLIGYIQGAQKANPDIKVAVNYIDSWTDSAKGKELSLSMNNSNADVIFQVAGGAGVGAFEAGAERGFQVIGVDSDQAMIYHETDKLEFAEITPTSILKNVDNSLFRALDLYLKDELAVGTTEVLGLAEDGMGLAENQYYEELVSEDLRAEIEDLKSKVESGEIEIDSVYGKSTDEVQDIIDSVRP